MSLVGLPKREDIPEKSLDPAYFYRQHDQALRSLAGKTAQKYCNLVKEEELYELGMIELEDIYDPDQETGPADVKNGKNILENLEDRLSEHVRDQFVNKHIPVACQMARKMAVTLFNVSRSRFSEKFLVDENDLVSEAVLKLYDLFEKLEPEYTLKQQESWLKIRLGGHLKNYINKCYHIKRVNSKNWEGVTGQDALQAGQGQTPSNTDKKEYRYEKKQTPASNFSTEAGEPADIENLGAKGLSQDKLLARRALLKDINEFMTGLANEERFIFVSRVIDGAPYEEIGQILNISRETVRRRYRDIRNRLNGFLEGRGWTEKEIEKIK